MPGVTRKNLHVPLEEAVYRRLRKEAERRKRPATEIAREAIEYWLAEQHRMAVHEAIVAYATDAAGSQDDLDTELESAATDQLRRSDEP